MAFSEYPNLKIKDCENDDTILAAKFVKLHKAEDKKKCLNEIGIMSLLNSPKFVQLVASFENPREIIMVMEYIEGAHWLFGPQKHSFHY